MWYRDSIDASGRWLGLDLTAQGGSPPLRIELAGESHRSSSRQMRLSLHGRALLWAHVNREYQGVWLLRAGGLESPHSIPPIRADEVRAAPEAWGAWWRYWASHVAQALGGSERGPLRAGRWVLRPGRFYDPVLVNPPVGWDADINNAGYVYGRIAELDVEGPRFELWGSHGLFALRALSAAGASRVKVWRKVATSTRLPPCVILSVTGMDMFALIDGHDRLLAAAVEQTPVTLLMLEHEGTHCATFESDLHLEDYHRETYERFAQKLQTAREGGASAHILERLGCEQAAQVARVVAPKRRSTCVALPGGGERWEAEVRARLGALGVEGEHRMLSGEQPRRDAPV